MPQYVAWVAATTNSSAGTQDLFVEVKGASGVEINIKRVRAALGNNAQTVGQDATFIVQKYRYTTTTAGSTTSFTPVPMDGNRSAANATAKVKTGTTACVIGTGSVININAPPVNGRAIFEWVARDDEDMIVTLPSDCFCVALQCAVASQVAYAEVAWVE
jgi:hypothetical protein